MLLVRNFWLMPVVTVHGAAACRVWTGHGTSIEANRKLGPGWW